MRIVAIVQARTGSTRLPGKALLKLGEVTMLGRVVNRVRRSELTADVLVATTVEPPDEAIVAECRKLRVGVFRGSEADVLDRYYHAAQEVRADAVVRITSDCPLIDPELIDELLGVFIEKRPDYASNCLIRSYPRGLDVEAMTFDALATAWRDAQKPYQREHVTPYLYENPHEFRLHSLATEEDYSDLRWTVDTAEDLELLSAVYLHFENRDDFGWRDVLSLMTVESELAQINRHVRQKEINEG